VRNNRIGFAKLGCPRRRISVGVTASPSRTALGAFGPRGPFVVLARCWMRVASQATVPGMADESTRYRIEVNVTTVARSPDGRPVAGRRIMRQEFMLHADDDDTALAHVAEYAGRAAEQERTRLKATDPTTQMP